MIRFRLLGEIELLRPDGARVRSVLAQPKRVALLACLALPGAGSFQRRDALLARLWPELDEGRARAALNTAVHFLRQSLGRAVVVSRGQEELGLNPEAISCDVWDFDAACRRSAYADADALYRGELMAAFHADAAADFLMWLDEERHRLGRAALENAREAGAAAAEARSDVEAVKWAWRIHELAPLDEAEARTLIRRLGAAGRSAEALDAFERFRARLEADLDVEPEAETIAAVEALRVEGTHAAPGEARQERDASASSRSDAAVTPASPRTHPRWVGWAAAVATTVVAAALLFGPDSWRGGGRSSPAVAAAPDRIVVLPFTVYGDSTLTYLGDGIVDLLSDRLALPGRLYPVDARAVLLADRERRASAGDPVGEATAARFGAGLYVLGSVTRVGGEVQLAASLNETPPSQGARGAQGTRRATALVTVSGEEEILAGLDEVARQLLAAVYDAAPERTARTGALGSTSLPALKTYLEAERDYREGRFAEALQGFRTATEIDTAMAIAYYEADLAAEWVGGGEVTEPWLDAAWARRDRLPEPERLMLEARTKDDVADRMAAYRRLLQLYPDLVQAHYELADLLFHYGHWGYTADDVKRSFETLLSYDPANADGLVHLARIAASERDGPVLDSILGRFAAVPGGEGGERGVEVRALRTMAFTDGAPRVDATVAEILRLDDETLVRMASRLARYGGRPQALERLYRALESPTRPPEVRAFARVMRASLLASGGRPEAALTLLDVGASPYPRITATGRALLATTPGLDLPADTLLMIRGQLREAFRTPGPRFSVPNAYIVGLATDDAGLPELLGGTLSARLKDEGATAEFAARLEEEGHGAAAALLRAQVQAGDPATVLSDVGIPAGNDYVDATAVQTWYRARALLAKGDTAEADRWLAAFTNEHPFSFLLFPARWLERARIADRAGRVEEARTLYRRFAEAWANAEEGERPPVEEARRRLQELGAGS